MSCAQKGGLHDASCRKACHPSSTRIFHKQTQSTAGPIEKERKLRWDARMAVVESTLVSREPILSVRRQLAELLGMRDRAGQLCVEQARVTREAGHLESARALALEGLHKGAPGAALEHAELLWDIGATDAAMKAVEGVLAGREWGERDGEDGGHERAVAAMKLARWKADTGQGAYEEVTEMFRRSISLAPKWWRPCFELARYTDALMEDSKARQAGRQGGDQTAGLRFGSRARVPVHQERGWVEYAAEAIGHYASALKLGADATFQALPRMLTVFFHLGSHVASTWPPPQKPPKDVQRAMDAALASMEDARRTLPVYVWLSCMPQLVSRVLHRHQEVCNTTHKILIRTTGRYPHQALWMLASSLMSNTGGFVLRGTPLLVPNTSECLLCGTRSITLTSYLPGSACTWLFDV